MSFFQKAAGILGMNARNHLYISKYNSKANKKFADDKLYTKHFLESRNIGVAKLFRVIDNYEDLRHLTIDDLPESFVMKPNHGYGGEGILVVAKKTKGGFLSVSGRRIPFEEIFLHSIAILDGKFSISGLSDKVIIEERLEPHRDFREVTTIGLPDVRVIVFNLVPVIAMVRVPTAESEGKANVHLGAVGAGIDIGSGKTTFGVCKNQSVNRFPTGKKVKGFQVPYWDEILSSAAKIQAITKIGFVAIDFVITPNGVKVLEVNARAGLMVQIANRVLLRARLQKIRDLKIPTPQKGVEIAKTLFSQKIMQAEKTTPAKPIIGLFESVTFLGEKNIQILAKIDLHSEKNIVDEALFDTEDLTADIVISDKRIRLPFEARDFTEEPYRMLLSGKYLTEFLIDPARKTSPQKATASGAARQTAEKLLHNIDRKLADIDSQIKLLSYFKPQNLTEQKEVFLANPLRSPKFFYKIPTLSFENLRKSISKIPRQCDHPLMPLFLRKIDETIRKIDLIEAINTPELQHISEKLWGQTDEHTYAKAIRFLKKTPLEKDTSKKLPFSETVARIEAFLKKTKLRHWNVKTLETTVADFQIAKHTSTFLLKQGVEITENRLLSLLAHEVETHIYRLENARKAPFRIFERGTAGYLKTEEGIASYNQVRVGVPLGEKVHWGAHRVIAAFLAKKMSFVDLFHYMKNTFELDDEGAWKSCLKAKRGLEDTSQRIAFNKDIIYFTGREEVEKFLQANPEGMKELYCGKIAIADLPLLREWKKDFWKIEFLPKSIQSAQK